MRKQAFVTAYAVGLYVHFLLNLGVAGYLLVVIVHATRTDTKALCQNAISNTQGQDQCSTVFNAIRGAYAALASLILVIELCESFPHPIPPILIGDRRGNCGDALCLPGTCRENRGTHAKICACPASRWRGPTLTWLCTIRWYRERDESVQRLLPGPYSRALRCVLARQHGFRGSESDGVV